MKLTGLCTHATIESIQPRGVRLHIVHIELPGEVHRSVGFHGPENIFEGSALWKFEWNLSESLGDARGVGLC